MPEYCRGCETPSILFPLAGTISRNLEATLFFAGERARYERRLSARLPRRVRRGRTDEATARQPDAPPREDGRKHHAKGKTFLMELLTTERVVR